MSTPTTDHEEIRRWAESKGGVPAAVDRTHQDGDVGLIRLMFPDNPNSHHGNLVEISWEEFFQQFDEAGLALVYSENSLFNKLVGRDTIEKREHGDSHASRHAGRDDKPAIGSGGGKSADKGKSGLDEVDDLKAREYTDAEGNVHHHTRAYMEAHRGG